ncbi:MAG: GntR family transcriptional regulator, partial [Thermomicrobiales bacterium]|nr:GntR family transcriptional regulator [Thermomicrobiales bacterium]
MSVAETSTLTRRIVSTLTKRIVDGSLAPGERVRQDRVAEEFGTSHVPVREAFRLLEAAGLLDALPRKGVRVALLHADAVRETAMMRAALEVLALEQSLPHLTTADIARARVANAEGEASRDIGVWIAANRAFHLALLQPCAMPRLLSAIEDLQQASERYLYAAWKDLDWQPRSNDEHLAMLDLLAAGEGSRAVDLLRAHIVAAGEALAA